MHILPHWKRWQGNMDKQKSILNIAVSLLTKIMTMVMVIVVKRYLIRYCGNEANGLNALYLSIIGFLSVAELGIGTAITFCMYKPIVDGDKGRVAALYHLFRRVYLAIGAFILTAGCIIVPFVPALAKDYVQSGVNLYTTFLLMLFSILITYLYGAKTALINAYRNNYITTAISSGGTMLQYLLQIAVLIRYRSYFWYLLCRIVAALVQWGITELIACQHYKDIFSIHQKVDKSTQTVLTKNIKAMFMHRLGNVLSDQIGSIIISSFLGVMVLGAYSNYTTIIFSVRSLVRLLFTPLISTFGHVYAKYSKKTTRLYFEGFYLIAYAAGMICYLGFYAVIDSFISLFFRADLVMERNIVFFVAFGGFVRYMRDYMDSFRDATGTFYNDRWKPLVEGVVNITLSIVLIRRMGILGVLVVNVITDLMISYIIEPYVLYRYAFDAHPGKRYLENYGGILFFGVAMLTMDACMVDTNSYLGDLLLNGMISVGISVAACAVILALNWKKCHSIFVKKLKE